MRIWGPGENAQFKGVSGTKQTYLYQQASENKFRTFCYLHQTVHQISTKTEPKWSSHIPGILDNHDLTEGVQHALNIENNIQKQSSEGGRGVKECLWTVSVCVWEGEIIVDLGSECDSLSACSGQGQERGTVVCCSGGLNLCLSVS